MLLDVLGETARHAAQGFGQLAGRAQRREGLRMSLRDGHQPVPNHQRQIVIVRILRVRDERRGECDAIGHGQALQDRGQRQSHDG